MVVWLFLVVPWVCMRFVIVVFPDHTHLLFLKWSVVVGRTLDCGLKGNMLVGASLPAESLCCDLEQDFPAEYWFNPQRTVLT